MNISWGPIKNRSVFFLVTCLYVSNGCCSTATHIKKKPTISHEESAEVSCLLLLRERWMNCSDARQKFNFCVSLIDEGIISVARPAERLRTIFEDDAKEFQTTNSVQGHLQVSLAEWLPQKDPTIVASATRQGWFLAVYYSRETGKISRYFLSNIWKDPTWEWGWSR